MPKITIRNIEQNKERVRKILEDAIQDDGLLNDIGNTLVTNMKAKTRLGKDPGTGGRFAPLDSSKHGTIYQRTGMSQYNKTSEFFRAKKSNLNFSGQLIDGIKHTIERISGLKYITINSTGERTPYQNKDGTPRSGGAKTNEELSKIHRKEGAGKSKVIRNFLGVSEKMKQQVINKVRAQLRRMLKRS